MAFAIGDIHGNSERLTALLKSAGLIDERQSWQGGTATLAFVGDFVDRGRDALGVIRLIMRLQREAQAAGGAVVSVLGNHDLLLVLAARYPKMRLLGGTTREIWEWIGGMPMDLKLLTSQHIDWLGQQPALLRLEDVLMLHADTAFYLNYGQTMDEINASFARIIQQADVSELEQLVDLFSDHQGFWTKPHEAPLFLNALGCKRLIHGHTPIHKLVGGRAADVQRPLIYADGQCVNLDGGIYLGGPGFVYRTDAP